MTRRRRGSSATCPLRIRRASIRRCCGIACRQREGGWCDEATPPVLLHHSGQTLGRPPGSDPKSSLAYPNGLSASWTYDAKGQLLQVCNATPTNVISQYDYTYDSAGRRIARAHSGTAFAQSDTIDYACNAKSELTNAVAVADANYTYAYDFEEIGNRRTSSECGVRSAEYGLK